ncbi:MAG: UDP-N-acetylglucosamine 2-epimerase (non-hydrolyzing) [Planctomycetes bacterium]|nr:UDP-N-acetylglucosamine 2-epimerase (non-hydrolyzing) [Planctomycetota bacterium]
MLKVVCVCGARPNFMKIAPVTDELSRADGVETILVHTGQHYDERMSRLFFDELGIPKPDINLEVGSASHAVQTAEVMKRFEPVCLEHVPDWVIAVGDVNSTIACALVAAKLEIKVAHVEAGLRSFDRSMPEEINRVLTDAISDLLLVSEPSGIENLKREGIADSKVHFVGNVMIDTLMRSRARADSSTIVSRLELVEKAYAVVTLHRPSNVDEPAVFSAVLRALAAIAAEMPVVFPIHPRSRKNLQAMGLINEVERIGNLHLLDPLGYLDFLKLMADSAVVLTDSGGIQEETTILNVPCLTLRENTERPITLTQGTNRLVGSTTEAIVAGYRRVRAEPPATARVPELWDGRAAERIVKCLTSEVSFDGS